MCVWGWRVDGGEGMEGVEGVEGIRHVLNELIRSYFSA